MAVTIHSLFPCLKLIDKHRDYLEEISADAVISYAKDGCVGILIDCDNALAVLHTGEMLDSAGDTASDINAGTYGLACLSNLMIGGDVTCFNGSAACADNSAEGIRKLFNELEAFCTSYASSACYDNISLDEVNSLLD